MMGNESLEDDDRCGRTTTVTTEENIAHVHRVVMDDRRLKFFLLIIVKMPTTVGKNILGLSEPEKS